MNLRELSQILGLSSTTVSRALNGYPEVSEGTRARVIEAAHRHHYRPNARAQGLATGRAMAIGHVIPAFTTHEMVNPVFADFIAGASECYAAAGFDMVLSIVADTDEGRAYRQLGARGTVDGVIVHFPRAADHRIALLTEIGLPFVVHGRATGAALPYAYVDVDNRRAFRRATAFLLDLGHRRIGLVNGLADLDFAIRREAGFAEALAARGLAPEPDLIAANEMTETHGHVSTHRMLDLADPPTAILVSSMISAIGVRRAAEERGLKLGRDLSVVTHDDALGYLPNGTGVPIFTATRSSVREAGRRAAGMLLARIADPAAPHAHQLMEAELMVGLSTGPRHVPAASPA